ncbi:MAG: hypothetical protein DRJ56_03660 [Thermoprotei archaeon]|nr:MAG: hypothetical protein DRJ56_03660 [Thermoprotei archaeon]
MKKEVFIAAVVVFIGVVIILAALGVAPPDPLLIAGFIFTGIGIALLVYAALSSSVKFYLAWGAISSALGLALVLREQVSPLVFLGALLIALAVIGAAPIGRR